MREGDDLKTMRSQPYFLDDLKYRITKYAFTQ